MNPMDCKQAQNVWSRVMAAQTARSRRLPFPSPPNR